jgi:signal transduction histidine kinase
VSDAASDEGRRRLRHDLRSPLTIVAGFAEVLAADKPIPDETRREYATRIQAAAEELRQLLDDYFED